MPSLGPPHRGRRFYPIPAGRQASQQNLHRRLVAGGLSADQARTLLRLLAEAEAGRFDRRTVAEEIAGAGYGPAQTEVAIAELLQAIARQAGKGS